jgi:hypothetical protein
MMVFSRIAVTVADLRVTLFSASLVSGNHRSSGHVLVGGHAASRDFEVVEPILYLGFEP